MPLDTWSDFWMVLCGAELDSIILMSPFQLRDRMIQRGIVFVLPSSQAAWWTQSSRLMKGIPSLALLIQVVLLHPANCPYRYKGVPHCQMQPSCLRGQTAAERHQAEFLSAGKISVQGKHPSVLKEENHKYFNLQVKNFRCEKYFIFVNFLFSGEKSFWRNRNKIVWYKAIFSLRLMNSEDRGEESNRRSTAKKHLEIQCITTEIPESPICLGCFLETEQKQYVG